MAKGTGGKGHWIITLPQTNCSLRMGGKEKHLIWLEEWEIDLPMGKQQPNKSGRGEVAFRMAATNSYSRHRSPLGADEHELNMQCEFCIRTTQSLQPFPPDRVLRQCEREKILQLLQECQLYIEQN